MNTSIEGKIKGAIEKALRALDIECAGFVVEHPNAIAHGDYSSNVAMVCGNFNTREFAQKIVDHIVTQKLPEIESIEIAGPGFINFFLSRKFYTNTLAEVAKKKDRFGEIDTYKGKKILVEHSSPNLFKPFHIGHLVNNAVGESVTRLCRAGQGKVTAIAYPSDVSLGIAKAVWGVLEKGKDFLEGAAGESEKMKFIGECYALGTREFEENKSVQERVHTINKEIYTHAPGEALEVYTKGRELTLRYVETLTKKLGSKFDGYIFESEAGKRGLEIVEKHVGNVFEKSDGAIIYDGERSGLHTRVFVNSAGLPTYEAKDMGLIEKKFKTYNPHLSLFVTDYEQAEYFRVVLSAMAEIHPEWVERSRHIVHGRLRFTDGKLSSRLGNVLLAEEVIEIVRNRVVAKKEETATTRNISDADTDRIAIGAIKFTILKSSTGKNIVFDIDKSISFEGDSGPYLQYTYARIQTLLAKAKENKLQPRIDTNRSETFAVERLLYRFPEVVAKSLAQFEPHHIAVFLLDLAREFNSMYESEKIIGAEKIIAEDKLAIAQATAIVIKNGLHLLGIETVERM